MGLNSRFFCYYKPIKIVVIPCNHRKKAPYGITFLRAAMKTVSMKPVVQKPYTLIIYKHILL